MADTDNVPVGAIVPLGRSMPDSNETYLLCDGRKLDSTDFSELYAQIGTTYGGDPDKQMFMVPDLRGAFLRGADHGTGRDPEAAGRSLGSSRDSGGLGVTQEYATAKPENPFTCVIDLPTGTSRQHGETYGPAMKEGGDQTIDTCTKGGDPDTRPVNVYVEFYIKAQS
jgi:hypothetical protein